MAEENVDSQNTYKSATSNRIVLVVRQNSMKIIARVSVHGLFIDVFNWTFSLEACT